jgi:hypothetical protein
MPTRHAPQGTVAVYGATGHTGGFILDELARRGIGAIAVGRSAGKPLRHDVPFRTATLDDAAALARAFAGCAVVINAAGPFLDTATPVATAALAAGCHYVDVTAEQQSVRDTLQRHDDDARQRDLCVIPAAGFYGGLADLLASALADGNAIAAITVAIGLDRWWPTLGTRLTGTRNTFPRVVVEDGRLVPVAPPAAAIRWDFGAPEGVMDMEAVPLSEIVTLHRHLPARRVHSLLSANALRDLRDAATAPPQAIDAQGRSAQRFTMQVVLEDARGRHRATARGRDIYAVSAPLVVEAASRLLRGEAASPGARTLGEAFDARAVLDALSPSPLELHFESAGDS